MKKITMVIEFLGTLTLAIPALILGGIIGICWGSFRQGYIDGKKKVS